MYALMYPDTTASPCRPIRQAASVLAICSANWADKPAPESHQSYDTQPASPATPGGWSQCGHHLS